MTTKLAAYHASSLGVTFAMKPLIFEEARSPTALAAFESSLCTMLGTWQREYPVWPVHSRQRINFEDHHLPPQQFETQACELASASRHQRSVHDEDVPVGSLEGPVSAGLSGR